MALIHEIITANNIAGFYNASQEGLEPSVAQRLFPVRKQLGLTLKHIKGGNGQNVALRPSAFDTEATLRDRVSAEIDSQEMPFFKEAALIPEQDRQELNLIQASQNQALIDTVAGKLFDDKGRLVRAAKTQLERMAMQVLATGKIVIDDNGVNMEYDYGVPAANKGDVEVAWSEASADPLADIDDAVTKLKQRGAMPGIAVMNANTLAQIKNNANTTKAINGTNGNRVTNNRLKDFFEDEYGLVVVEQNQVFTNEDGQAQQIFPDGYVTLAPNDPNGIGKMVFGTTPEESDLLNSPNAQVELVDQGIAVTTTQTTDPVNVLTKVSMVAMPSFEGVNHVYQLHTAPSV